MTLTTDTWLIPYPESTDRPCDGYLFTQQMAERVDTILDQFDVNLARVEVIPLARVSVGALQIEGASGDEVTWTNVDFDTTGNDIANLSLDNEFITAAGHAYHLTGGNVDFQFGVALAGTVNSLTLTGGSDMTVIQRDNGLHAHMSVNFIDRSNADEFFALQERHVGTAPAGTPQIATTSAYMWYVWLGDF